MGKKLGWDEIIVWHLEWRSSNIARFDTLTERTNYTPNDRTYQEEEKKGKKVLLLQPMVRFPCKNVEIAPYFSEAAGCYPEEVWQPRTCYHGPGPPSKGSARLKFNQDSLQDGIRFSLLPLEIFFFSLPFWGKNERAISTSTSCSERFSFDLIKC